MHLHSQSAVFQYKEQSFKVMDSKHNPDVAKIYYFRYMREYRAVAVLWGLLTIIWCILNIVCFVQPQWIGDTEESPGYGHAGVFSHCFPEPPSFTRYLCNGTFGNFDSILNNSFRASTFFCGVSALLMLICVVALLLFFCFKKTAVFVFCGILEVVAAVFLFLACVIYPSGWGDLEIIKICGPRAGEYRLGDCGIRWAYILAILGIFDAAFLAMLAFFLASKRARIVSYYSSSTVTKSEINGYSDTHSKKSMPMKPELMVVPAHVDFDRYSDNYSRVQGKQVSRGGFQL